MTDTIDVYDPAAFDQLRLQLVQAGFEPLPDTGLRRWRGPLTEELRTITEAESMVLHFSDGWPFSRPFLFVQGLEGEHLFGDEGVCLWREDDDSLAWVTWEGIDARIQELAERLRVGYRQVDLVLDGWRAFERHEHRLAIFDPTQLPGEDCVDGQFGPLSAVGSERVIGLSDSIPHDDKEIRGLWFFRETLKSPPRNLDEFLGVLKRSQQRRLARECEDLATKELRVAALFWNREGQIDALILLLFRFGGHLQARALEPAPCDCRSLQLRSGPDAAQLSDQRVVVFGCGAIGSHCALILGESGVGKLHLVDGDKIRPGNCSRSAVGLDAVGERKVEAVKLLLQAHAPWVEVVTDAESPWARTELRKRIQGADLVVDATGLAPFAEPMSRVAEELGVPLVSAALFRGGAVGRVRRQVQGRDVALYERRGDATVPEHPSGTA